MRVREPHLQAARKRAQRLLTWALLPKTDACGAEWHWKHGGSPQKFRVRTETLQHAARGSLVWKKRDSHFITALKCKFHAFW